jgi:stage II sporulation protein D
VKRFLGLLAVVVFLVVVILPALLARGCVAPPSSPGGSRPAPSPAPGTAGEVTVNLLLCEAGKLLKLPLETYVAGVVAAEMPASFSLEALKAQAVAARTYVLRRMREFGGPGCDRHAGADICDDPTHGQAWVSGEELRRRLGFLGFYRLWARVRRAADETRGMVVTCGGALIDPVYHSTCAGHTEDAADVWGAPVPYLQGVECKWDAHSPYSAPERVVVSAGELRLAFAGAPAAPAMAGGDAPVVTKKSGTGRVLEFTVDERRFSGVEARARLHLRSTLFEAAPQGGNVVLTVRGYGHGVGLCQYGADGWGQQGATYMDILKHYYTGVEVVPWTAPARLP